MLRNVLGVLCNVLGMFRNVLGVFRNVLGILRNVLDVLCNVLGILRNIRNDKFIFWLFKKGAYIILWLNRRGANFCLSKSQECLWQDWYIYVWLLYINTTVLLPEFQHFLADNMLCDAHGQRAWHTESIITEFSDVESLNGKPKLFFFEACRGSKKHFIFILLHEMNIKPHSVYFTVTGTQPTWFFCLRGIKNIVNGEVKGRKPANILKSKGLRP